MAKHLRREIENLKKNILSLSAIVEQTVQKAVTAIENRDDALAMSVIEGDARIDRMEVELEEECLKILALHQPVAIDLRFIVSVLKINNDLERIGDLAVNIAERAVHLAAHEQIDVPSEILQMAELTRSMLRRSLDSFVNSSTKLAHDVCTADEEVDRMHAEMYRLIQIRMENGADRLESLIQLMSVSRYLERIADLATNIAEDVIYMLAGEIVRHKVEQFVPPANSADRG